ncbi:RxLR-like protein [Plasmopara halstedii]|uniref:RxLR-like protein n=1 Tax=Plasmopara halstedii TaxID=4781 RepID=A0A0P1AK19_PLAHL|nr:RxLR-like protein [Plasmopara halstedii]CEG41174.1 RxLR-like protein [Plasmopara halstedii]|eukprot:XP_024577543.1 RxLR-like protein [Plasmopara halstedii]
MHLLFLLLSPATVRTQHDLPALHFHQTAHLLRLLKCSFVHARSSCYAKTKVDPTTTIASSLLLTMFLTRQLAFIYFAALSDLWNSVSNLLTEVNIFLTKVFASLLRKSRS